MAISSRSEDSLRAAAEEIEGEVHVFPADTGDLDRLRELPGEVGERVGSVDILVANTGGPPGRRRARQLARRSGRRRSARSSSRRGC